jgi:Raf kinase inhibitor-like YbhB/YbcL family protein
MAAMRVWSVAGVSFILCAALTGCGSSNKDRGTLAGGGIAELRRGDEDSAKEGKKMRLQSTFENGGAIARKHSGEGDDLSPPLSWEGAPEGTKTLALICDDPEAPSPRNPAPDPWVHWVIYNIPGSVSKLPEGLPRKTDLAEPPGAKQGANSFGAGKFGYNGPMPPPRSGTHRYFFKLYALDTELSLDPKRTKKKELLRAMQGRILAQGELMGTYERK